MNIQITSTQDFLDALRANPEFLEAARKEILTEELIRLPTRLDRDLGEVKQDLGELKQGFGRMQKDIGEVKQDLGELKQGFGEVRKEFGQVKGIVFGIDIDGKGMPRMVAQYRLFRTRVVRLAENNRASEEFNEAILAALTNKVITQSDYERVMVTDLIVRGRKLESPDTNIYIVAEASFTLELEDLVKVQESRDAIEKVFTGADVVACLYTADISDDLCSVAARDGVGIFIEEDFGVSATD